MWLGLCGMGIVMTTKTLNLYQRINAVQNEVEYVQKNRPSGMKYSIVSHDDVTAAVKPYLVKNGVLYYPVNLQYEQVGNRTQVTLDLKFCNIDDKEDTMLVSCIGFGIDAQDKGPGKAVSYAVKYGLLKALGLVTGDDADYESVDHSMKEPEKKEKLKGPLQRTALKAQLNLYLKDVLASTSLEEFEQAAIDYKAPLEQAKEQWAEFFTDQSAEPDFPTFKEQVTKKLASIKREEEMFEQQREDTSFNEDFS